MHTHVLWMTPKHVGNVIDSSGSGWTEEKLINPSLDYYIKRLLRHSVPLQIDDPLLKNSLYSTKLGKNVPLACGELIELIELLELAQLPLEIFVFSSNTALELDALSLCRPNIDDTVSVSSSPLPSDLYSPGSVGKATDRQKMEDCYGTLLKLLTVERNSSDLVISITRSHPDQSMHWLLVQITAALGRQRLGGTLVLGLQNTLWSSTRDVLFFLSTIYGRLEITKPLLSNQLSGDKYVICKDFLVADVRTLVFILGGWIKRGVNDVRSLLNIKPPRRFTDSLVEINASLGQRQLESIRGVYLESTAAEGVRSPPTGLMRVGKCEQWCQYRGLRLVKDTIV